MRTIIFDIKGPYAHFRKPYAPASPVTYPFPPPPTVLGMMGAILGLGKDEYHEALGWNDIRIGIRLLKPIQIYRTALNLHNTKKSWCDIKSRLQIPYEFLKNPAFRIYAANLPEQQADHLTSCLSTGKTAYTPSLGLAQCLAEISFVADAAARPAVDATATFSVIPLRQSTIIEYEPGRRYERVRVAAKMGPDRTVHEYREAVTCLDNNKNQPVMGNGLELYEVNDEYVAFF
ncbi:MAG: type I-B CRISPR-associated protein Cas5b [Thermodesulfobacteriota bacterium]|nr:type I-B CRISPR-associated protein Cas5b [Thermodesulfobacteriota bacterium]